MSGAILGEINNTFIGVICFSLAVILMAERCSIYAEFLVFLLSHNSCSGNLFRGHLLNSSPPVSHSDRIRYTLPRNSRESKIYYTCPNLSSE
jgi:hypothetical protein